MGAVLGGGKAPEPNVDDSDRAMLDIKVQRDQIRAHRKRFDAQERKEEEAARKLVAQGRKPQAMLALRKKKQSAQLALECDQQLNTLEGLISNIEMAKIQKNTVDALAAGAATLRKVQASIGGVDVVQRIMDEADEASIAQQELNDVLAGAGIAEDDADALAEFDRLQESLAAQALVPSAAPITPVAPVVAVATTTAPVAPVEEPSTPGAAVVAAETPPAVAPAPVAAPAPMAA